MRLGGKGDGGGSRGEEAVREGEQQEGKEGLKRATDQFHILKDMSLTGSTVH